MNIFNKIKIAVVFIILSALTFLRFKNQKLENEIKNKNKELNSIKKFNEDKNKSLELEKDLSNSNVLNFEKSEKILKEIRNELNSKEDFITEAPKREKTKMKNLDI